MINADAAEEQELNLDVRGFEGWKLAEHMEMYAEEPEAENTWNHPDRIVPRKNEDTIMENGLMTAVLKKESWNVFRFRRKKVKIIKGAAPGAKK